MPGLGINEIDYKFVFHNDKNVCNFFYEKKNLSGFEYMN